MAFKEYHQGTVRNNDDPEKRGRLIIEAPTIVSGEALPWAEPLFHFVDTEGQAGSFWIPNNGSMVEVEIEGEHDSEFSGLMPKWRCNVYPLGTVPVEFETHYPQRRGWKTAAGHIMFFDDTEGSLEIQIVHASGARIWIDNDGSVRLQSDTGTKVIASHDNKVELYADGVDQAVVRGTEYRQEEANVLDAAFALIKGAGTNLKVAGTDPTFIAILQAGGDPTSAAAVAIAAAGSAIEVASDLITDSPLTTTDAYLSEKVFTE